MIKLIIFDLDGVIVDTKLLHFRALNLSLKKNKINHQISYQEHLKIFDGLPTKEKLKTTPLQGLKSFNSLDDKHPAKKYLVKTI